MESLDQDREERMIMTLTAAVLALAMAGPSPATRPFAVRGKAMDLHLYGAPGGAPVVLVSGDGGWTHLTPQIAPILAADGYFVVGLNSKQYLSAFTDGASTLHPDDVPRDLKALVDYAAAGAAMKPILIGISEGAGLVVLAAVDPQVKAAVRGVIGLGLPDENELGWRFRDSIIYITHGAPKEPTFSVLAIVDQLAPLPLAELHSTRDEYVPLDEARRLLERAREPKRMWVIEAVDHRFSDKADELAQRLREALEWVTAARANDEGGNSAR